MNVIAKFKCYSVTDYGTGQKEINFQAVTTGPGNESWSKWTPSGILKMMVTNPDALSQFEPGKEYYLTFAVAT